MKSETTGRALLNEWRSSEAVCEDLAAQAAAWSADFFVPDTATFKVAYTNGDAFASQLEPNATTSSMILVANEADATLFAPVGLSGLSRLQDRVNECLIKLPAWDSKQLLPWRSFGPLPLFSVSYLAQALSYTTAPLSSVAYAVCLRRILFELYQSQKQHWGHLQKSDQLHPFVVFHCNRALLRLRSILEHAFTAGKSDALLEFQSLLSSDDPILTTIANAGLHKDLAEELCGTGAGFTDFRTQSLDAIVGPIGPGVGLDRAFLFIEGVAFSQAIGELAKHPDTNNQAVDPSVLAFALQALSDLNGKRHAALLGQGVRALAQTGEHGRFASGRPFHIDTQGRALAVPSVQIASALLAIQLSRIASAENSEIRATLDATSDVEFVLVEEQRQVDIVGDTLGSGFRRGWCSDRAPSAYRVDAWVTAHATLFFLQRLRLLRAAKRRNVLARYSWVAHASCKPKWDELDDPNTGLAMPTIKETIERAVELPVGGKRVRAPVFLLYGPPGTSKTSFVHAIASRMGWDLVTLSPSDFVADSLDRIELRAREIFEDLGNLDECVILLDEMDSLLRDREILAKRSPGTIMEFVVPALLPKLQQLRDYTLDKRMAVFFVSNYYETIDSAILRSGRIDSHLQVLPYARDARAQLASRLLDRDPHFGPDEKSALLAYLDRLPCNLVYRDIERLIQCLAGALKGGDIPSLLGAVAPGLGVSSEVYAPSRRPMAYGEFCGMLARLKNRVPPAQDLLINREGARVYLTKIMGDLQKDPEWHMTAEAWITELT